MLTSSHKGAQDRILNQINSSADIFRFLADPTRLKILELLFSASNELCVNEISLAVGATHSATSHQLARLEVRGIVVCNRVGQTVCYEITDTKLTNTISKIIKATRI
jgi:ArsR family transcriptional regulator, lead/cadmium/zinc/bismuth-responsive transcriptional repressor